jgi:hypothetical protein
MSDWTAAELDEIGAAVELEIAPSRPDGTRYPETGARDQAASIGTRPISRSDRRIFLPVLSSRRRTRVAVDQHRRRQTQVGRSPECRGSIATKGRREVLELGWDGVDGSPGRPRRPDPPQPPL